MPLSEAAAFISAQVVPEATEVEAAKAIILEFMRDQPRTTATDVGLLVREVRTRIAPDPAPLPPGCSTVNPDPNEIRARMVTYEAVQQLHGQGALIAHGPLQTVGIGDKQKFSGKLVGHDGTIPGVEVSIPVMHHGYTLARACAGDRFLLADGDVYLARLNRHALPSRVRRCIREALSAFRHGDYLSASMTIGAASESLWMRLGRVVRAKNYPGRSKLDAELAKPYPNVGVVTGTTWDVLRNHGDAELKAVFPTSGDRAAFKEHADTLRARRNYANHAEDADEDEVLFRFNETGLLLLNSAKYFDQLQRLLAAVEVSPAHP